MSKNSNNNNASSPSTKSTPSEPKEQPTSALKSFLKGGFGGMSLVVVGYPLDLIKVRLQTTNEYKGIMDCGSKIVQKEGVRGLYRGMASPLIGVAPIFAVCFWGYDVGLKLWRWGNAMDPTEKIGLSGILFAGGFSAIPATAIMTPIERVKVLMQVEGMKEGAKAGPLEVTKRLYNQGGIASLYKGTVATLLRDVPGSIAWFGAYEVVKKMLTPAGSKPDDLAPLAILMAGGMAGVANWTVAIPPDVIKSRLQTAPEGTYKGIIDCATKLIKTEGPAALFKGLVPAMVRAFPANAACFLGAEVSLKVMNMLW